MLKNRYDCLDLNDIRSEIASLSFIEDAREYILTEEVVFNPLVIRKNLKETDEALKLLNNNITVSFDGIYNVENILEKAEKGITLNGSELNLVLALNNHSTRIKKQFQSFPSDLSIRDYSDAIMLNNELYEAIDEAIDTSGAVKEDASAELKKIFNELTINENRLMDKANQFMSKNASSLQEAGVFVRNNRICFLIRNVDKNKFGGYSYGSSASGQAQYVEPGNFIDLNNTKADLEERKDAEIFRILSSLTYLVRKYAEDLRNNYESLVKLNVIFAKAFYGFRHNGKMAVISDNDAIELKDICHPLIDPNKVVSNCYSLKKPYSGIVISGSNTGGKTVSLKLIGLSVLLSYLGIPLICEYAEVPFYNNVFVDIDDNQSISSSLSTFSAHISNINDILKNADKNSLILIDELISGTDPKEAQAISLAIIEKIEELGSRFIITTHFDDIKNRAYDDEKILLSSVGFDLKELKPTYRYYENSVGASNALEIASRYFDDASLIERSREILEESQSRKDQLMNELSAEIAKNTQLNDELKSKTNELNTLEKALNDKINAFEKEKDKLREDYIEKLNEELEKKREEADKYLEELKSNKPEVKKIARKIEELTPEPLKEEEPFEVNDTVRINDNDSIGKIVTISNENVTVEFNGIIVKTKLKDLHHVKSVVTKKQYTEKKRANTPKVSHELNLVGKRVEEALDELEVYLDNALSLNYTSVRIIHGIGTGALRKAIHEKLKKLKFVSSYKLADYDNGGSAITIVEFRK